MISKLGHVQQVDHFQQVQFFSNSNSTSYLHHNAKSCPKVIAAGSDALLFDCQFVNVVFFDQFVSSSIACRIA